MGEEKRRCPECGKPVAGYERRKPHPHAQGQFVGREFLNASARDRASAPLRDLPSVRKWLANVIFAFVNDDPSEPTEAEITGELDALEALIRSALRGQEGASSPREGMEQPSDSPIGRSPASREADPGEPRS